MVHPYACKGRKQIASLSVDGRQVYHWPPRRLAWGDLEQPQRSWPRQTALGTEEAC